MQTLADALERGRRVHEAVHFYNERDLDDVAFAHDFPQYAGYLDAWIHFCQRRHFVPILNEHRVGSRRHQLAGTIDCLGILDGKRVLLDFKTGNPADVAADLQTAAYHALALEWCQEDDADPRLAEFLAQKTGLARYSVQLCKDATFHVEAHEHPGDYSEFMVGVKWFHICARRKRRPVAAETV
jgi:PD-(D/E)XK nuclease superfamily